MKLEDFLKDETLEALMAGVNAVAIFCCFVAVAFAAVFPSPELIAAQQQRQQTQEQKILAVETECPIRTEVLLQFMAEQGIEVPEDEVECPVKQESN